MQINKISNITFKENSVLKNSNSTDTILTLKTPNASVKFQQNQEPSTKTESTETNALTKLGSKLHKTFNMLKNFKKNEIPKSEDGYFYVIA